MKYNKNYLWGLSKTNKYKTIFYCTGILNSTTQETSLEILVVHI